MITGTRLPTLRVDLAVVERVSGPGVRPVESNAGGAVGDVTAWRVDAVLRAYPIHAILLIRLYNFR